MRRYSEDNLDTRYSGIDKSLTKQNLPYVLNQPWMKKKYKKEESKTFKHHYELLRFSEWASPTKEERAMRGDVVERLKRIILDVYPEAKVEVYGSFESDLCVPQSDIDLVVFNTNVDLPSRGVALTKLALEIQKHNVSETFPSVIATTRVPIIKLVDAKTKCMVDINFENETGVKNTKLIKHFLSEYPFLRPLTIVLKYFLKLCHLNDTWTGGIGSYTLLIMIISFLQRHTSSKGKASEPTEEENLCTILTEFLKFYGSTFDYKNSVISVVNGGRYLSKEDKDWVNPMLPGALSVEDPQSQDNDLGRASFNIEMVKASFQRGYNLLTDTSFTMPQDSIVSRILYVPKEEIQHRNEIKNLYGHHKHIEKIVKRKRKCSFTDVGLESDTCNICSDDSGNEDISNLNTTDILEKIATAVKPPKNSSLKDMGNGQTRKKKSGRKGKKNTQHRETPEKRSQKRLSTRLQLDDMHFPSLESVYLQQGGGKQTPEKEK